MKVNPEGNSVSGLFSKPIRWKNYAKVNRSGKIGSTKMSTGSLDKPE